MARQWCKHYRGMHEKDVCEAGVAFSSLPNYGTKLFRGSCPCFGPEQAGECKRKEYPTAEEMESRKAAMAVRHANMLKARVAIVESIGVPWRRGVPGVVGEIDCPVCEASNALRFSRAAYNGHIHASCRTEGCVSWME